MFLITNVGKTYALLILTSQYALKCAVCVWGTMTVGILRMTEAISMKSIPAHRDKSNNTRVRPGL